MPVTSLPVACVLAYSAQAVSIVEQTKIFEFANSVAVNEELAKLQYEAMPQGRGKDHTLWDWTGIVGDQKDEVDQADKDATTSAEDVAKRQKELDDATAGHGSPDDDPAQRFKKCELTHNEEINLFYQCMQDGANNYSLDHYGGEKRSFPRWLGEAQGCHDSLAELAACDVQPPTKCSTPLAAQNLLGVDLAAEVDAADPHLYFMTKVGEYCSSVNGAVAVEQNDCQEVARNVFAINYSVSRDGINHQTDAWSWAPIGCFAAKKDEGTYWNTHPVGSHTTHLKYHSICKLSWTC